jgi:spermidine/putrescine transport system permease protein
MKHLKNIFLQEIPFLCFSPALLWQCIFLFLPLCIIILFSFASFDHNVITFSTNAYTSIFAWVYLRILLRSLLFAFATALLCLLCAYPVAYVLALYAHRWKTLLLFLLTLPFWTNFLVQVYAWFFIVERHGLLNYLLKKIGFIDQPIVFTNSLLTVFIVMVYCYLPFMIMPLYSVLEKIDIRLLEASDDLGATPWQTFMRITLPLSVTGIKTGFFLVFVPAFGEFVIPALIGGSRYMMAGSLISYFFLVARDFAAGSAFTCIAGLILLLITFCFHRYINNKRSNHLEIFE